MKTRAYANAKRRSAGDGARSRVIAAARVLLGTRAAAFSVEAVARAAGVTRLTVYNQFGSRRALLEAVFDDLAQAGGLGRVGEAMADPDPVAALRRLVDIFCDFWNADYLAMRRLYAESAIDEEFGDALRDRNERRLHALSVLLNRLVASRAIAPIVVADIASPLFALTSFAFFAEFKAYSSDEAVARRHIRRLVDDTIDREIGNPHR